VSRFLRYIRTMNTTPGPSTDRELAGHAGALHVQSWSHDDPSHVVVIAHGYGEHIGRYGHVAAALAAGGATVVGLDHVGHGRSAGERALIPSFEGVIADLHLVVRDAADGHPGLPVVLLGHSMGGLIATRYAQTHGDELAGLVISAPLLGNPAVGMLLGLDDLPEIPIDPTVLSRDEAVQAAYMSDPLVYHGPFLRPTLAAMAIALLDAALDTPQVGGPVLWQHGEADQLVDRTQSGRAVALFTNADVTTRSYPGARHEIFNETDRDAVLADTVGFIGSVVAQRG